MIAQLQVAGHEVRMEMAEEHVADLQTKFFGVGQVNLNIAPRVHDDGCRTLFVSQQIGSVGEATEVVLFQDHRSGTSLTARDSASQYNLL
ncbi:MAG: hypothetical protein WB608_11310 [Terracidiphilus sp.]